MNICHVTSTAAALISDTDADAAHTVHVCALESSSIIIIHIPYLETPF